MENASKALIIAASVLIAILIVALGVSIFNRAQNTYDTTSLDATEINMFNNKFDRYADMQMGSQVKSLISTLIANANTNKDNPSKLPTVQTAGVQVQSGSGSRRFFASRSLSSNIVNGDKAAVENLDEYVDSLSAIRNFILSTHTYKISFGYAKTGLIDLIIIDAGS